MALSITSCKKDQSVSADKTIAAQNDDLIGSKSSSAPLKLTSDHVYAHVEDANGQPPVGDATLLFDNRGHTPVLAPDGHQLTLGEYNTATAWAEITCMNKGTHVVMHAKGLIPNGVYTMWALVFKSPGFDGTFVNLIGNGALGAPDGSENVFTASSDGTASLSVNMPEENLSIFGRVGNCLGKSFEVHLVAAYHSDNMTHGSSPGNPSTWVVQFGFPFYGSQLGAEKSGAPLKVDLMHMYGDVEDADMMPPKGDNTLLFNHTGHAAVLAPNGHPVTLREFNAVSGWADVKCINAGTHVVVHLKGLIPNGVYTIWVMPFKSPGFDGTGSNLIGVGALGAPDGSQNVLTVNGQGNADLSVTMPAGSLSVFGSIPICFGGVYEVLLSGAYHLDGMTHGSTPGMFSSYVLQFGFPIMGSKL